MRIRDFKVPDVELANGKSHAAQTAGRNDRGHSTAIRQSGIEDRLRFRDVIAQASRDVFDRNEQ